MNIRSASLLIVLSLSLVFTASAQSAYDLVLNKPVQLNGVEYGYTIRNECSKEVSNLGTFRRYEVTVYVANRSGSSLLFPTRQTSLGVRNQDMLAHFDCLNATGAKLTSKTTAVRARPQPLSNEASAKQTNDKPALSSSQLSTGHLLEDGETITKDVIVIVPDGEQPHMRVRVQGSKKSN